MKKEKEAHEKGYRVSKDGKIVTYKGRKRVLMVTRCGYHDFTIRNKEGKTINIKVHRLQAFQKYGDALYCEGIEVRHKNDVKLDNRWENILIGTHSDNMMDIPKELRMKNALHATSFVRKYDKEKVREFHKNNGNSYKKTMGKFGISSKGTLHFILNS